MTPNHDKDPALLEQARELVKAIKPIPLYDELDKRMPVKPGYTLRYEDLRRDFAIEIAYETLARTQAAQKVDREPG